VTGITCKVHVAKLVHLTFDVGAITLALTNSDYYKRRRFALTGEHIGTWSLSVTKNWRITFGIDGTEITDLDYEDYH
jgi:proteic killer suppression protein